MKAPLYLLFAGALLHAYCAQAKEDFEKPVTTQPADAQQHLLRPELPPIQIPGLGAAERPRPFSRSASQASSLKSSFKSVSRQEEASSSPSDSKKRVRFFVHEDGDLNLVDTFNNDYISTDDEAEGHLMSPPPPDSPGNSFQSYQTLRHHMEPVRRDWDVAERRQESDGDDDGESELQHQRNSHGRRHHHHHEYHHHHHHHHHENQNQDARPYGQQHRQHHHDSDREMSWRTSSEMDRRMPTSPLRRERDVQFEGDGEERSWTSDAYGDRHIFRNALARKRRIVAQLELISSKINFLTLLIVKEKEEWSKNANLHLKRLHFIEYRKQKLVLKDCLRLLKSKLKLEMDAAEYYENEKRAVNQELFILLDTHQRMSHNPII